MRFVCLMLIVVCFTRCNASNSDHANDTRKTDSAWKLSWSEEFNYTGLPDSTKWSYETGGNGWGNNELQYYTSASPLNVQVSNGTLKLSAIKQKMENREYTSARLVTRGKKDFTYGRIEIRAKLPPGRGLWPAIWMLGSNISAVGWPMSGEIDIMEHVGYEKDSVLATIHTDAYNHVKGTQKTKKTFIADPYTAFHNYWIEWTPEYMDFYKDSTLYNHIVNEHKTKKEWPFDDPFFLVLNIAVGGNLGGKYGVDTSVFPGTMEVDYVRVYTKEK